MVQIDWKRILALSPDVMTDQDKDELYETVAWYLPDHSTDRKHLIQFVRVTQEILKFKSHQVDSLMNELDDIAAKQGEEEARDRQDLLDEIDQLKGQLEYHKRLDRDSGRPIFGSNDELKSEVVRLEMQIEEVLAELQEREKELMNEKIEVENYASQVATLQREKEDLGRELAALQEESQERMSGKNIQDSPEFGPEKQEELADLIRQKNKHITQLLDDIESLEKQNLTLRTKLTNVCDELSEATSHINEMTMHLSQMKHINDELEKKLVDSEERNKGLMGQIEELSEEKTKHDKQLDQFNETFKTKVQEWKEILEAKEMEISKAEEEIRRLLSSSSKYPEFSDLEVNKKVAEQEEQIVNLKNELLRATSEINSCAEMIENFKEKQAQLKFTDSDQFQGQILMYEERIKHLEEKLRYAEEDAQAKAEEISEIVIQLREYEMGEFGLSEAMNRIKQLEKSLEKRDLQIEKLVQSCNNMEIEFENLEEQNMALRDRSGISASEEIDTTNVKLRFRKDLEVIENLKFQLDRREEELIKAKLKCRKLIKFIKLNRSTSEGPIGSSEDLKEEKLSMEVIQKYMEEKSNIEKRLLSIIKENDALRKGMHEILESIQNQDGTGTVEIQSNCLERLLEALDSRHVSGWYHPAMRLQAQLNNIEGKNEELRKQIRSIREEERSKSTELEDAHLKIRNLENQLFIMRSPRDDTGSKTKTPESEPEDVDLGIADKQSLMNVEQEQRVIALETEIQELKLALKKGKTDLEKVQNDHAIEKEDLSSRIMGLEKLVSSMEEHVDGQVVESSKLQSQIIVQERQIAHLKLLITKEREDNERLYKETMQLEEKLFKEILRLQSDKVEYVLKIENLEKELLQSVPKSELNAISKELTEVRVKYQDAVALSVARYEYNSVERLEEEVRLLQREKNEVLDELRSAKEKLTLASAGDSAPALSGSDLSIISEKLAASEVRELNEKQKSAHLEKINLMLRSEIQDLEAYNKEMSELLTELKDVRRKYEDSKREEPVPANGVEDAVCDTLQEKIDGLQNKLRMVENDRENFRELFEISRSQYSSLENYRDKDKQKINFLNEQILLLQSAADEKSVIARLSHELLTCQLLSTQLKKEKADLEDRVTKLVSKNLFLEAKVDDAREQNFEMKRKHLIQCENLHRTISDLRRVLGTFTIFPSMERIQKMKKQLKLVQEEEVRRIKDLKNESSEYSMKKEELAIKMEGLDALLTACRGDSKQLMDWYSKGSNLRLEEARCKRQNQFLSGELEQLEKYIKQMDDEIIALEESNLSKEKEWEKKQILWEQSQLEMFELLKEKGVERVSVPTSVQDESTETSPIFDTTEGIKRIVEDQAETIKKYEVELQKFQEEIKELREVQNDRDKTTESKQQKRTLDDVIARDVTEEAEKAALKVTVQSLQNIIRQKEETIFKYQELLKEGRDEFSKSSGKFQDELRMLHEAMTKQSKAYVKLKNSLDSGTQLKNGLPMIVEKYLTKIQELEDDLAECQMTLASINRQLITIQQEKEKWQALAEERLSIKDDLRQRLEADYQKEVENYKAEIENCQLEIERLKRCAETSRPDGSGDHKYIDVQEKELQYESDSTKEKEMEWLEKGKDKMKNLERQLKFARDESTRLREQVRLLQAQKSKRPKTASSITSRSGSESKSSLKEESLQSKVKTLEELLKIAKEREQDLIEGNQRRIKSAEEVARWGEKKKSQQTIQNLNSKLKEKEAEIEILKNKNESFRNMIHKIEKDRDALEVQLKAAKDGPNSLIARMDKIMAEKFQLEKEVAELKEKLGMQQRHESGIGAAVLFDKLENQERKLAVLELASRGRSTVVEELQKLQNSHANLEKVNLRLESENLALHLQAEKDKATIVRLTERNGELEKLLMVVEEESEIRQFESDRTISSLNEKIGKISENRSNYRKTQSSRLSTCPEKLRKDFSKLKEDYKALRAKYLEQVDKNRELEEEVKKCRYQIQLLEEKDLADSIARTNSLQVTSQLSQELIQVKSQLAHKTHLLNRVKVLLTKAAAKEKALTEKVSALQSIVPT